ncbi:tetratricopeptide repeat protein, partial [Streptomyces sp. NPDC060210]
EQELSDLTAAAHPARDGKLAESAATLGVMLGRGLRLEDGWQAWQLGMVPNRHAREVMGVPVTAPG